MEPARALAALADLAPAGAERVLDVARGGRPLVWLADAERAPREADVDRLAAQDALHRAERILRRGWGFVAGRAEVDGARRVVRVPLLTQPVRLERGLSGYRVVPAGDVAVTPLVPDRDLAAAFEAAPGLGSPGWLAAPGTTAWLRSVAEAAGLPVAEVRPADERFVVPEDGLILVVRAALFVERDVYGVGLADALRTWSARPGLADTALATVYGGATEVGAAAAADAAGVADAGAPGDDAEVLSPLPLTAAQAGVVRGARVAPLTVVSGPPGNGKSHAVAAAALDVVQRGGSVLVATRSAHAADVLAELFARYPGPAPVLFGDAERRAALAATLAGGLAAGAPAAEVREAERAVAAADAEVRRRRAAVEDALTLERRAAQVPRWQPLIPALAGDAPGAFEPGADLDRAAELLRRAGQPRGGWFAGWRAAAARSRARRCLGAPPGVPLEDLAVAVEAGAAVQAAGRLAAGGGTDLAAAWDGLFAAERARAEAVGAAMRCAARSARRWDDAARRAAAGLAVALRAGRNRRRELLAALPGAPLVRALPLWVGTVADTEDLLPPVPGLFDLVVLDEASHCDQLRAAPVLARARRALVVGDPRQLRFVSFVSDVDVDAALARHGADARLDVRRVSAFDLAAGAAPTVWLDEHHRCVPHLIGFSARRFYAGRLSVATRHPRTDEADAIEVVRVADPAAEVAAVVAQVRALAAAGQTGIAALSPFRAQADAIEAALVDAFGVAEIERLRLRAGTVHAFQGGEARVVVASLAVAPGDAGRLRFLADPHLFNVLVTRARERMVVVTSLAAADGLVGEYLAWADGPRPAPAAGQAPAGWAAEVAAELARLGVEVRPGYETGAWRLDLCAGPAADAVAVLCGVHPDGAAAHVARQRALRRAGWRVVEAFPSRRGGDAVRAALELAADLRAAGPRGTGGAGASRQLGAQLAERPGDQA